MKTSLRPKPNPRRPTSKMRPKARDQDMMDEKTEAATVERGNRTSQPPGPTGYAKGGTVRGMGAATKGGKFGKNG